MAHSSLQFAAELLTTVLIHFIWQGAALAISLLAVVKLLELRTASIRYLLSVGALAAMGLAPFVSIAWHLKSPERSTFAMTGSGAFDAKTSNVLGAARFENRDADASISANAPGPVPIEVYALFAWLAGVALLGTRLAVGFAVTIWIRAGASLLPAHVEQRARSLGKRLGVRAARRVFVCSRAGQAAAIGFLRPVVLIPAAWLTEITPDVLEAIIAHELAHIRRWDLWVNLVQRLIEMLLFYHPAVWWLSRRIQLEREMCCDEIAAACFDRAAYARSLQSVARFAKENFVLATSINGGANMKLLSRVRYLLGAAPADATGNWTVAGMIAMLFVFGGAMAISPHAVPRAGVALADDVKNETVRSESANDKTTVVSTSETTAAGDAKSVLELKQQLQQIQNQMDRLKQTTQSGNTACDTTFLSKRFKHRISFATSRTQSQEGGRIEIREVWGTRPQIEVGGQYLVRGKYALPKGVRGMLYFYAAAGGPWGKTASLDLQTTAVDDEDGEFALIHGMAGPGSFHLILTEAEKYSRWFADVYFDDGGRVDRNKQSF